MSNPKFRNLKLQESIFKKGIETFSRSDKKYLLSAFSLAKRAHRNQKRDEGEPYIIHPLRTANTLIYDLSIADIDIVIAGLLHDVVEDTEVSAEEIKKKFGERAERLVGALTRDETKETKKEKFEKTIVGAEDVRLVKACDWLDNLRSLMFRRDRGERWQRHLREAKEMYIPLAKATHNKWLIEEMEKVYNEVMLLRR